MIKWFIMAILSYLFCGFAIPYGLYGIIDIFSPGKGKSGRNNMVSSVATATLERSKMHLIEKFLVACDILIVMVAANGIMIGNMTLDKLITLLFFLALVAIPEIIVISLSTNQLAFCWALSMYSRELSDEKTGRKRNSKDEYSYSKDRSQRRLDHEERKRHRYEEEANENVKSYVNTLFEKKENNLRVPDRDNTIEKEQVENRKNDMLKSLSKVMNRLQEEVILSSVTDKSKAMCLVGSAIFSKGSDKPIDIRFDNAIYDGAVHFIWRLYIPSMLMDLNLMRIVKQPEYDSFNNAIEWATGKDPVEEYKLFWNDIDKFMTLGIKKVKVTMWFRSKDEVLSCLKFEFATNSLHKENLRSKLIDTISGLQYQLKLIDFTDLSAFSVKHEVVNIEELELKEMLKAQENCDYSVSLNSSVYTIPSILQRFTYNEQAPTELKDYPTNTESIIDTAKCGAMLLKIYESSTKGITLFNHIIDKATADIYYSRAKGCMPLDFEKTYRVTKLKEILAVIANTEPVIKKNSQFVIAIGLDNCQEDTWITLSSNSNSIVDNLNKLNDNDEILRVLYSANGYNLMQDYKHVEYMYILWDLSMIADVVLRNEHSKIVNMDFFTHYYLEKYKPVEVIESDSYELVIRKYKTGISDDLDDLLWPGCTHETISQADTLNTKDSIWVKREILKLYDSMRKGDKYAILVYFDSKEMSNVSYMLTLIKIQALNEASVRDDIDEMIESIIKQNLIGETNLCVISAKAN